MLDHGRHESGDEEQWRPDVDRQHLVDDRAACIGNGEAHGRGGVVDEHIDTAEAGERLLGDDSRRLRPAKVRRHDERLVIEAAGDG